MSFWGYISDHPCDLVISLLIPNAMTADCPRLCLLIFQHVAVNYSRVILWCTPSKLSSLVIIISVKLDPQLPADDWMCCPHNAEKHFISTENVFCLFVCLFYRKSRSSHFTVIYCCIKAAIHFTPDFASDIHYALRITTSSSKRIQN